MSVMKNIKQRLKKVCPVWVKKIIGKTTEVPKIKRVNKYLNEKYEYIADKYIDAKIPTDITFDGGLYPVWTMWWQGEEQMPEVIRMCYNSQKINANGHTINLITKDNYKDIVEMPQWVIDKFEQKIISLNQLSDIIRACLLSEYGGLWIDATMFITAPLPEKIDAAYWTAKWKIDGYNMLWDGFSQISTIPPNTVQRTAFLWYSCRQNPVFVCLKEFWFDICKNENEPPYYFLAELFLSGTMHDRIPAVKKMSDDVPYNNGKCLALGVIADKPYRHDIVADILRDTSFHKLSWKESWPETVSKTGEQTVYGFLKTMY